MASLGRPATLALMMLGMACVPRNAGYDDVRAMVSRTGHDVRWQHQGPTKLTKEARAILAAPLTEGSAVRLALLQNREIQATFAQLGVARGDLVRALRLPNPSAEGGLKFAHDGSPGMEVSLSQDLAELILLPLRSGAAHAEFAAAKVEVAGRITDLIFEVRKAFTAYLADQQILELRKTVLEALAAAATAAEEIHSAGNMTDLDLANQQVIHEEARVAYSSAATALATSREQLNVLLGVSGNDANWQASARLQDPGAEPMKGLEADAVTRSAELAATRHRYTAAAKRANLARAQGWLPELKAGVAFEREEGEWGYGPVAEIELPLFYQGQGEVDRAEAEMRREQDLLAATGVRVRAALRAVKARESTARDRALHLKNVVLPMRERILQQTQLQFNAMNTSVFQLLLARRDQVEAGRAYIEALREYWLAAADLEQILAGRLPEGAMARANAPAAPAATQSAAH